MNATAASPRETTGFWRTMFDAMPIPMFVMDHDLRIFAFNASASQWLQDGGEFILRQRNGEVMHCVNARRTGGCGQSAACKQCVIRKCVSAAFSGNPLSRQRTRMEVVRESLRQKMDMLVTTAPAPFEGQDLALLILEDITELTTLRELIPMCARCKRIRDDHAYWHGLEEYLQKHLHLDFTHGMCPTCLEEMYPELYPKLSSGRPASAQPHPSRAI